MKHKMPDQWYNYNEWDDGRVNDDTVRAEVRVREYGTEEWGDAGAAIDDAGDLSSINRLDVEVLDEVHYDVVHRTTERNW